MVNNSLRDYPWKPTYESRHTNLVSEFFIPALQRSIRYDRIAGFYSSSVLTLAARGLAALIRNGGTMRLITGAVLSDKDIDAINRGILSPEEALAKGFSADIEHLEDAIAKDRIGALAWLVAAGKLEIKVGLVVDESGKILHPDAYERAIMHQKVGIFTDINNDSISFSGSINETRQAWAMNSEEFKVFTSWKHKEFYDADREKFDRVWNKRDPYIRIFDLPEAETQKLLVHKSETSPLDDPENIFPDKRKEEGDFCPSCGFDVEDIDFTDKNILCPKCRSQLPLNVVGFENYLIQGSMVDVYEDMQVKNGWILKADYHASKFEIHLTDKNIIIKNGRELDRTRYSKGEWVLVPDGKGQVKDYVISKMGELTYEIGIVGERLPKKYKEKDVRPTPTFAPLDSISKLLFAPKDMVENTLFAEFVKSAPFTENGKGLLLTSSTIIPYPHQINVADSIVNHFPSRYLLADEVGLGKTIEAGLALKELYLMGMVNRVMIISPKNVLKQWQEELREKFNLHFHIFDGFYFYDPWGKAISAESGNPWNDFDLVITSGPLVRRPKRAEVLISAKPWDIVIIDEAHHMRRKTPKRMEEGVPNLLLELGQKLQDCTDGLLLLSATPIQMRLRELHDLLLLLGLGGRWGGNFNDFEQFYHYYFTDNQEKDIHFMLEMVKDFQEWGLFEKNDLLAELRATSSKFAYEVEQILFQGFSLTPEQSKNREFLDFLQKFIDKCTPLRSLMFRNTRPLLRRYGFNVAQRKPEDHFINMTEEERELYKEIENYIRHFYNKSKTEGKPAIGFIMAVYRRRLTSSFHAVKLSLKRRKEFLLSEMSGSPIQLGLTDEDIDEDFDITDQEQEIDDEEKSPEEVIASYSIDNSEEIKFIDGFLNRLEQLTTDSKRSFVFKKIEEDFEKGTERIIIFTQYTDTLDNLRNELSRKYPGRISCYSGRGGEIPEGVDEEGNVKWRNVPKELIKNDFKAGRYSIMLCTDAASEGLNFQFCDHLYNYDLPWNPMRIEQRIGRIDRVGQRSKTVTVRNFLFNDTIEGLIHERLRERINLFEVVIGELQPILQEIYNNASKMALEKEVVTGSDIDYMLGNIEDRQLEAKKAEEALSRLISTEIDKTKVDYLKSLPTPLPPEKLRQFIIKTLKLENIGNIAEDEKRVKIQVDSSKIEFLDVLPECNKETGFSTSLVFDTETSDKLENSRFIAHDDSFLKFIINRWTGGLGERCCALIDPMVDRDNKTLILFIKTILEGLQPQQQITAINIDLESGKLLSSQTIGDAKTLSSYFENRGMADIIRVRRTLRGDGIDVNYILQQTIASFPNFFQELEKNWKSSNENNIENRKKRLERAFAGQRNQLKQNIIQTCNEILVREYLYVHKDDDWSYLGERMDINMHAPIIYENKEFGKIIEDAGIDPYSMQISKEEYFPYVKRYRGEKKRMLLKADQGKIKQKIPNLIMRWNKNREKFNAMIEEVDRYAEAEVKHEIIGGLVIIGGKNDIH